MTEVADVLVCYDERVLAHEPDTNAAFLPNRLDKRVRQILSGLNVQWRYPEHPGRVKAVLELLASEPIEGVRLVGGRAATYEELSRVHTSAYLKDIYALRGKNAWLDLDTTAVSPGSVEAAEVAAGTSIAAVEALFSGEARRAFALVRPPGHHAEPVRARGFCLFNNVAVAAAHAQAVLGCERVLILDWDAHHGNGTQDIFYSDPDVLFFDIHRAAPFYPGSGAMEEVGAGLGDGTTVNVPVPAGTGDRVYLKILRELLAPAVASFKPDLILVSAGFDAHGFDLALNVSYEGFAAMTGVLQELAEQHCEGRLAMVLEGGYNVESLSHGVHSVLKVMAGGEVPDPAVCGLVEADAAIAFHAPAFQTPENHEPEDGSSDAR